MIYGIDIDPAWAAFDGQSGEVRIGSQDDPEFLNMVVDEMGGVDIILDDGSHIMDHIKVSLEALFPRVQTGGLYMIEKLHTAFWRRYGGGVRRSGNFFNYVRDIFTDMHWWYHNTTASQPIHPKLHNQISSVHVYDSIVVLEKDPVFLPVDSMVGPRSSAS